jgi:hypothetical protein
MGFRGMPRTNNQTRRGRAFPALVVLLALLAGGCSLGGGFGGSSAAPADAAHGTGTIPLSDFFSGSSAKGQQTVANGSTDVNCPPVEVRQGASTLTIGPPGDKSAMSVKYQGAFLRQARECAVVDGNMVMKIGVQGRVIVGPMGGPGQVDVPLRIAVVQETPGGMRPIATKFVRVPVVLRPNDGNVLFTHIEEGLSFPLPAPTSLLDDYIVYVGFDPLAAQPQEKPKPPPRPKSGPRPAAGAN